MLVWRELDKAAVFLRELGMAVGRGEEGMERVAKGCGVVLVPMTTLVDEGGRSMGRAKTDSVGTIREWSGSRGHGEGSVVLA